MVVVILLDVLDSPNNILFLFCCKAQGKYRCPALVKASEDGKQKLVGELIQAGADVKAADQVGGISRLFAVWRLPPVVMQCLYRLVG